MLKKMSALLTILLLLSVNLMASDTRISALGYRANFYVSDYNNMIIFPSAVNTYNNLIYFESMGQGQHSPSTSAVIAGTGIWRGGLIFNLSKRFVLGFVLDSRTENLAESDTKFSGLSGLVSRGGNLFPENLLYNSGMSSTEASHKFTIVSGMQMSSITLGLSLTAHKSYLSYTNPEHSNVNFNDELSSSLLVIGVSSKIGRRSKFEGSVLYNTGDFKHVDASRDTAQYKAPYGYNSYGVNLRLFYAFSKKVLVVPFVSYISGSGGYTNLVRDINKTSNIKSYKKIYSTYSAGVGVDILPFERTMLVTAVGITGASLTTEQILFSGTPDPATEYSYRAMPFVSMGLEANLNKWMGVRFTCYELIEKMKITNMFNTGDQAELSESGFDAVFGFWFKLKRFTIDTIVDTKADNDFLHNPFDIFSGTGNQLFTQLSLTYNFK